MPVGDHTAHLAAIVQSSDDAIVSKDLAASSRRGIRRPRSCSATRPRRRSGQPITELIIPPERLAEEVDILARLGRGETIEHFETERVAKGGQRIYVSRHGLADSQTPPGRWSASRRSRETSASAGARRR